MNTALHLGGMQILIDVDLDIGWSTLTVPAIMIQISRMIHAPFWLGSGFGYEALQNEGFVIRSRSLRNRMLITERILPRAETRL